MTALRLFGFTLAGLAFGSFLTVVVHRTPHKESVVRGTSRCPSCRAPIGARDNVPVVSYLMLRGRCRRCRARIAPEYPLTEVSTALLFAGAAVAFPDLFVAALMALFLGVLLAVAIIDARHRIIPNVVLYPSLVCFAAALLLGEALGRDLDAAAAGLGFLGFGGGMLVLAVVAPGGMGMGDVKLAALVGLVLGSQGLAHVAVGVGLAVLAGGLGGLMALAAGGSRRSTMPFGPYLALGGLVATFWTGRIAEGYLTLLR